VTLAHPPNPMPITKIYPHNMMFIMNMAVQLGRKNGGFSTELCILIKKKIKTLEKIPVIWSPRLLVICIP